MFNVLSSLDFCLLLFASFFSLCCGQPHIKHAIEGAQPVDSDSIDNDVHNIAI